MVLKPEPIFEAVESIKGEEGMVPIILLTPQGERLRQERIEELAMNDRLLLIAGHYEGVDERVIDEVFGQLELAQSLGFTDTWITDHQFTGSVKATVNPLAKRA